MKATFDQTKKNIKKNSLDFATDYFKEMTNDLCLQFSREAIKFYKQYIYIKEDVFRKEKLLGIACEILTKQENIITELRGFVISTIAPMMELIEREKDGIVWKYKDLTK